MKFASRFVAAALLTLPMTWAHAQVPPDIAAKLRELGRVVDPVKTADFYKPLHPATAYDGVHAQKDLNYGPDPRQALDLVSPREPDGKPRPVLIFVHGGGFVRGDRVTISPFYSNIMTWAVKNGFLGVNMTYRLAPKDPWPAGRDDVARAVDFVRRNISKHDGDPQRIWLMGHSAGAMHVASYSAWMAERGDKPIAGAIMVSAFYEFLTQNASAAEKAYLGEDPANYAAASTIRSLPKAGFPLMIAYAELDPQLFVTQAQQMNKVLCDAGKCPHFVPLKDHNHISEAYAIGTADTSLSDEILKFTGMRK
jgi:acetyl esterase/lipase